MYCDKSIKNKTKIGVKLYLWSVVLAAVMAVVASGTDASGGKSIQSFKFEEEFSIRKALAMLGSTYEKNIVPTPGVDGTIAGS